MGSAKFKIRATCSSNPGWMKEIEGDRHTTIRNVLDVIADFCPVFPSGNYVVSIDGSVCKIDFDKPLVYVWEEGCIPKTIYVHRCDFNVLNAAEMRKLREMRDFLNRILGE